MKILYLPFTVDEAMFDLFPKALQWCDEYRNKGEEVPVIIHLHRKYLLTYAKHWNPVIAKSIF